MKTVKFNVGFSIEVPLVRDGFGKVNLANLVAPYIDDFMKEMQLANDMTRAFPTEECLTKYGGCNFEPKVFEMSDTQKKAYDEAFKWVNSKSYEESITKNKESHEKWLVEQNRQCRELYNMSWEDFKSLSFGQMQKKREECNVIWLDGKWTKRCWLNRK